MKKLMLFCVILLFSMTLLYAQNIAEYNFTTATDGSLMDMSSGTTPLLAPLTYYDDAASPVFDIGFNFTFCGVSYSQFSANSNGQMRFGSTAITTFPSISLDTALLQPLSGDNAIQADGQLHYKVFGSTPNRIMVVEWASFRVPYSSTLGTGSTMQAWFYETTNMVKFVYGAMYNNSTSSQPRGVVISNSNVAGTVGNVTNITTTPTWSTASTSVQSTSFPASSAMANLNSAADGARRMFSWAPPLANQPPNPANVVSPQSGATMVQLSPTLTWASGGGTPTGYKLYFGTTGTREMAYIGDLGNVTSWTPPAPLLEETNYSWQVIPYNANGDAAGCPVWNFTTSPPGLVIIGTGTNTGYVPIYAYYGYTYSQTYYLASELGGAGNVTSIAYYWNGAAANAVSNDWTVYMGQSSNAAFASGTAWESGLTQVFTGTVNCPASPGWINITLTTPFPYDGVNNLVIGVDENAPGYDYPYGYFLSTSAATQRSIYYYNDSTNPDPASPPPGNIYSYYPNIMMNIAPILAAPPAAPMLNYPGEHASGINPYDVHFNWTPDLVSGGVPDGYNLYLAATSDLPNPWNSDDFFGAATLYEGVNSGYAPAYGFDYGTNYTWTVEAYAAGYDNVYAWPPYDFTTMPDPTITSFPYVQDFEVWPPTNWDLTGGTYSFGQYLDGTGNNWAWANFWGQTSGNTDIMTTPPVLTNDPVQLSFDWSHQYSSTYPLDALTVQISNDMSNWNDLWYKGGTDLDSADGAGSTSPGTGVLENVLIPGAYLGSPFWIRFYGFSGYGPDLFIDDVTIGVPLAHDVGVVSIDINPVVASSPVTPMATVMNYGINPESFNVQVTIGTGYDQSVMVSNLDPGMSQQVSFPPFSPVSGTVYGVQAQTLLPGDENAANNQMSSSFVMLDLMNQAYADVAYSGGGTTGPATFSLSDPGTIVDLPDLNPWQGRFLSGADWINGGWWGSEYYDAGTSLGGVWWQIDTSTGAGTNMGGDTTVITGVAVDPVSGMIYGSTSTDLYTINPLNGAKTMVGSFGLAGSVFITIAYNNNTQILYGIDIVTDALYTINPVTGAAALVGALGVDLNYAQDMAFDQTSGLLYLAGYTTTGSLYWVDTNTGAASLIAPFQGGWEIDGFVIPYGGLQAPDLSIAADGTLSWGPVAGATGYKIYGGADPYGTLTYLGSTTATSWLDPAFPQMMQFYQVTADDTVIRGPLQIRYEGDVYRNVGTVRSTEPQTYRRYTPPVK